MEINLTSQPVFVTHGGKTPKVKSTQPAAPAPPPGGNIENRKPPAEPSPPSGSVGQNVNVYV